MKPAILRIPSGKPPAPLPSALPGPHDTDTANFLVEAVFRADAGKGGSVLVSCLGERGYELGVDAAGAIQFRVKADAEATVVSPASVVDGRWHHVIAECDRKGGALRLYLDGRRVAETPAALRGSARHDGELRVGRGADSATAFSGGLDFLRIALGTLADSKTTIEELYAWQFDGPFLRDFTGRKPTGPRAAGAIDAVNSNSQYGRPCFAAACSESPPYLVDSPFGGDFGVGRDLRARRFPGPRPYCELLRREVTP